MMNTLPSALVGLTVLDFSTLLPGPMASLMLAEAGAEVIKIESPDGDRMREREADFALLNRGKRSVCIDLKQPGAVDRLRPLIERADVLLEQFRPGVMERLGLGFEILRHINPRLIYCSITGYGPSGPRALKPGHDLTYAAEAGLLAQTTGLGGEPVMPPAMLADIGGGTYPAVINILLALIRRQHTGQGERIDISMFDGVQPFLYPCHASAHGRGHWPLPGDALETGASPRYSLYRAGDGRWLAVASTEPKFWTTFCDAIDLPEPLRDDGPDPETTRRAVAERLATRSAADWAQAFEGLDLICSPVLTYEEAQHAMQDTPPAPTRQVNTSTGPLPSLPLPLQTAFLGPDGVLSAPALGEANDALLAPAGAAR